MIEVPTLPGLYYRQQPRADEPSPLRSDVAGFIGRTRRGPVGAAVRVEGFQEFQHVFGGLDRDRIATYSIRGYFENGGQVAHIVRVLPDDPRPACGVWQIGRRQADDGSSAWNDDFPTAGRFRAPRYRITASSPGSWADGMEVKITYQLHGPGGKPTVLMVVRCPGEPTEHLRHLVPGETADLKTLEELVARQSRLIRIAARPTEQGEQLTDQQGKSLVGEDGLLRPEGQHLPLPRLPGPLWDEWTVRLRLPDAAAPDQRADEQYLVANRRLGDRAEVAFLATPSLHDDLPDPRRRRRVIQQFVKRAAEEQDRLVLIDSPPTVADSSASSHQLSFVQDMRGALPPSERRAAAVYFPWLRINDPLGSVLQPMRRVPPSGHVAGVISRVDRQRGAHFTPANVPVLGAVDVDTVLDRDASGPLNEAGVNLIRCLPGKGLLVWGGRTLDLSREAMFLAHRRFIHRLVRAMRRVADPVVFDTNGPQLWLLLVRAVTTVLQEAFRGGALRGSRPEEAFRVRCDELTNPLTDREQGRVHCEVDLALAAPMEFITIRVSVSREGQVEVFDA